MYRSCRSCSSWCMPADWRNPRSRCPSRCRCTCRRLPRCQSPARGWYKPRATRHCSTGTLPCTPIHNTRRQCRSRSRTDWPFRRPARPSSSERRPSRCSSGSPCTGCPWCRSCSRRLHCTRTRCTRLVSGASTSGSDCSVGLACRRRWSTSSLRSWCPLVDSCRQGRLGRCPSTPRTRHMR